MHLSGGIRGDLGPKTSDASRRKKTLSLVQRPTAALLIGAGSCRPVGWARFDREPKLHSTQQRHGSRDVSRLSLGPAFSALRRSAALVLFEESVGWV